MADGIEGISSESSDDANILVDGDDDNRVADHEAI